MRMTTYPGGKAGSGVYQRLIGLMPVHDVYVEPFLGGGAVMRRKRPARLNIGCDLDERVVMWAAGLRDAGLWLRSSPAVAAGVAGAGGEVPAFEFHRADGVAVLQGYQWSGSELVYADPPYLRSTRSCNRRMYRYELDEAGHRVLLDVLLRLPCRVMVSGYFSELYASTLAAWRSLTFGSVTRAGRVAQEVVWLNFPEPAELHDYRYLGQGYRERERLNRLQARWRRRLAAMPVLERRALLAVLQDVEAGPAHQR